MASRGWTCRRCKHLNQPSHRKCRGEGCTGSKPPKRVPKHREALNHPRSYFAQLNVSIHGGDETHCACCGRELVKDGLSQRDHDHRTGWARGLVCWHCNNERLRNHTLESLRQCVAYLERVERFYA